MELSSVYVGVEDMGRAVDFYSELFESEPEQEEERYSIFSFGTVDFGLYNAAFDGYETRFGNNCVPNFEVADVDDAYERIESLAPKMIHETILEFGDYRTFHFVDSEGNEIEVFSLDST
ncbi:lactoylglutathione lyase family protein [Halovivax ruber XH-70]|uniref:Lactoylglutathione lyase family protein n=1 Tax=Halovivax ruber (strain DSM 18193 / JCM 13892 / XH-70) TaxID=797302 RepID=L0ICV7_HALRX|nr:VOC family protein [Halovivax ruber]AGB16668.1 lactoylglutathione lyase family protein [Halovivax ruber XH-70]